jgi:hypothetical protein
MRETKMMIPATVLFTLIQLATLMNIATCNLFRPSFNTLHNKLPLIRGGATKSVTPPSELSAAEINAQAIQKYKLQQQHLLQLRSTFLSEALAARGINVGPTMMDVATPDGSKPPQQVDWDCALSTRSDPKTCLYSFDAEPNTKVVCPVGTTQYISLSALNRLRRTDPSKVEPMWHSQYAILKSWFNDDSEYSLMQFVGMKGFIVSTLLLDLGKGKFLKAILAFSVVAVIIMIMPILEIVMSRLLTSSILWMKWTSWGKFVHAALPLKILIGQMAWKAMAGSFAKLENVVREYIVDWECSILEHSIPVTIGVGGGEIGSSNANASGFNMQETEDEESDGNVDQEDSEDTTDSESDYDEY